MRPSGDRIVGYLQIVELHHNLDDLGSRDRMDHRQVGNYRDSFFREVHFAPIEGYGQFSCLDCLDGVLGDFEGFSGKWDIDFVGALLIAFGIVAIASESISIGQMLEYGHIGAAFRAGQRRIFFDSLRSSGHELVPTLFKVLTSELLFL